VLSMVVLVLHIVFLVYMLRVVHASRVSQGYLTSWQGNSTEYV